MPVAIVDGLYIFGKRGQIATELLGAIDMTAQELAKRGWSFYDIDQYLLEHMAEEYRATSDPVYKEMLGKFMVQVATNQGRNGHA